MRVIRIMVGLALALALTLAGTVAPVFANDWAAIEKAAKAEGKVVIYSFSSRAADVKKTFEAAYPGITVEVSDLKAYDLIEKVDRENAAKVRNADVILVSDGEGSLINDLLPRNVVTSFVPDELVGVIPEDLRDPMLVLFTQANVPFYNTSIYSAPPIDSWWDLTRPEWKGKVIMNDPLASAETLGMFIAMVQHADEMAADYKREFGQALQTRKGESAGHEFIRRLIANDPVFMTSGSDVIDAVAKSDKPLIGLASSPKMRDVANKNLPLNVVWNVKPALGVTTKSYLAMLTDAPHPNAAKLLIRWMLGDVKGGNGYAPFYVTGSWSGRSDVPPPPGSPAFDEVKLWQEDPAYVWANGLQVRDFWMTVFK